MQARCSHHLHPVRTAVAVWRAGRTHVLITSANPTEENKPMALPDLAAMIFWSSQGAVVFAGAYAGLAVTGRSGARAKLSATAISYLGWMLAASLVYGRLGDVAPLIVGDGAFLVALFITAFASAAVWLLVWLLWPARQADQITWP
jgi:hypothetical protein